MIFSPLFLDLSKKNCLILGGGIIATRKLLSLKDSGMIFTIISPEVTKEIESFAKDTKNITILASGSQTIDGRSSIVLESPYAAVNIYSDGSSKFFIY